MSDEMKKFSSLNWEKNDTLRSMTAKFNAAIEKLEELNYYAENLSPAYQDSIGDLTRDINNRFSDVISDFKNVIDNLSPESVGLKYVDNTSDADKPISNAQKHEFDNIYSTMVTSIESEYGGIEDGENPEISDPIKEYIRAAVVSAIREIAPERNVTSYGVATENDLGVVRASNDVEVNPNSGKMSIPKLSEVYEEYTNIKETFDNLIMMVSQNSGRIKQFTQLQHGSTTGDAELIDGRVGYNGTVYDTIGTSIRMQMQLLIGSINEVKNTYKEAVNSLKKEISLENVDRIKTDSRIKLQLGDIENLVNSTSSLCNELIEKIGDISAILSIRNEPDLCTIITGLANSVNDLTVRVNELSLKIDSIEASM